jgi:glycolate oxidase FAD binding subunit
LSTDTRHLPLTEVVEPTTIEELTDAVTDAVARDLAIYPMGGATSLDFGQAPQREGIGLSLSQLTKVIDYPARDMTITVQAGITIDSLAQILSPERQCIPLDVPQADRATVGGVIATNPIGPRCYGHGTARDYVIGIQGADSQGQLFKAGGRVVKNVAGYDFCKLLTGSLGTLAIITQVTLRLKPMPDCRRWMACRVGSLTEAEQRLAALVHSKTRPTAIELLAGDAWPKEPCQGERSVPGPARSYTLLVQMEGTEEEVGWMEQQLTSEWHRADEAPRPAITGDAARRLDRHLAQFPARKGVPLVLQVCVPPSRTTRIFQALQSIDPGCDLLAHAGMGVILARLSEIPDAGLARTLVGQLQPLVAASHGHVVVLSSSRDMEMTRQAVWGHTAHAADLMWSVKQQLDPANRLNPGRFVYP